MARIPRVNVTSRSPGIGAGGAVASGAGASGRALSQAGRTLQGEALAFGAQAIERDQSQQRTQAALDLAELRAGLTEDYIAAQAEIEPGAPGFTENFTAQMEERANALLEGRPDWLAQEMMVDLAGLTGDFRARSMLFEAGEAETAKLADLDLGADVYANTVRADPTQLDAALEGFAAAVRGADIPPAAEPEVILIGQRKIAEAALRAMNEADPEGTRDLILSDRFAFLPPGRIETLLNDNQVHQNRLDDRRRAAAAEAAALAATRVEDDLVSLRVTGQSTVEDPQAVAAALGPEDGAAYLAAREQALAQYSDAREIVRLAPGDVPAFLDARAPQGEGFAQELDDYNALITDYSAFRGRLIQDPAGVVAEEFGITGIAASLAEQERLGVPVESRRVLSDASVGAIVGRFGAVAPDQYAATIEAVREEIGNAWWPDALRELVAGGLPAGVEVVSVMDRPTQTGAREQLAQALATGTPELYRAVGLDEGTTRPQFREAVNTALDTFLVTAAAQDPVGAGVAISNTYTDAVEALALQYMAAGREQDAAIERAAADVINNQYDFRETFRVPVDTGLDGDEIEAGAAILLSRLTAEDIGPLGVSLDDGLTPELRMESHLASIRENGYWVTDAGETGLTLMVALADGSVVPVRDRDGMPYGVTFREAAAAGLGATTLDDLPQVP